MAPQLSEGSLSIIMNGGKYENPILQVLGTKKIQYTTPGEKERYRLLLSDGKNLISSAMLSMQMIAKVTPEIPMFTVIKINRHVTSVINNAGSKNRRILILLDIEIVETGENIGEKIGDPVQLQENDSGSTPQQPKPAMEPTPVKNTPNVVHADVSISGISSNTITNPIISLSPYNNKWVIKARVMNKSAIRTWSNSRGEGKLFSLDLTDDTGEIRATAFRDLVDKFYEMIEVDKVYYFSKCQVKVANKQFSTLKNDYEMTFTNETVVQECDDGDSSNIPQVKYKFVEIDKIGNSDIGSLIDVIGVCKSSSDLQTFTAKSSGKELKKVDITLIDQSNHAVSLTLWGSDAQNFDGSTKPVILIKGAKVGEFGGGRTISSVFGSILKINPNLPEAHRLRGWFDNGGDQLETVNLSARADTTQWMTIQQAQEGGKTSQSDKVTFYQTMATVMFMKAENLLYKACPSCNKKVIDFENGMYRCEKCNREYPNFKHRLLAHANVADWSSSQWATLFNDDVERILGMTAEEVGAMEHDLKSVIDKALFKQFLFKFRTKLESFNDETRLQTVATKVTKIQHKELNSQLIARIQQLSGITL